MRGSRTSTPPTPLAWVQRAGTVVALLAAALPVAGCDEVVDADGPDDNGNWDTAHQHLGEEMKVCGPVIGVGTDQDDVFLNVGFDYPNEDRFTIVLWDVGPTDLASHKGKDVCVTGTVSDYQGVAQVEVRSVDAVKFFPAGSAQGEFSDP